MLIENFLLIFIEYNIYDAECLLGMNYKIKKINLLKYLKKVFQFRVFDSALEHERKKKQKNHNDPEYFRASFEFESRTSYIKLKTKI